MVDKLSIRIQKNRYFTKRDQFKEKEYVVIYFQDPNSWKEKNGEYKPKKEYHSCGEVHNPESWVKAEQKLREIFDRKLQHALAELGEKKSWYINEA